jgi:hypothetical protein
MDCKINSVVIYGGKLLELAIGKSTIDLSSGAELTFI